MRTLQRWLGALVVAGLLLPAPALAAAPARYFYPTGHWVQGDFLGFFDEHGGLDLFGYPRTEPFYADGRLVQYFQRARMESWPENPPPYNVQLMLIGDAVMGPGDPPIPASQIPPAADASDTYFPPTGHTLSGPFRDFFNQDGGLAIFGYPTSEPYRGPSGFVIQRFQRARMELHPELPPPYDVSLGLLGDEYIFDQGKVPLATTQAVPGDARPSVGRSAEFSGRVVYETSPGGNIVVSSLDGSGARVVAQGLDPSWSPDGKRIAYAVWGWQEGIYVANADGTGRRLVYAGPGTRAPVWSPDGTQIAFYHRIAGYQYKFGQLTYDDFFQVVVARVSDGSSWLPRDQPTHSYSPSWSPDGQTLVFLGNDGLYLGGQGRSAQRIPSTDASFTTPAWSPDGKQIAFTYWNHDHWDVGLVNPDGSGMHLLTYDPTLSTPSNNAAAAWSPSGDRLVFLSDRAAVWGLEVMNADGSGLVPLKIMPLTYEGSFARAVAWTK